MYEPSYRSTKQQEKVKETIKQRQVLRDQHIKDYIQANLDEKARLLRVVGPGLMEDIGDEIREWFYQWYKRAKCFDKYPTEEQGGSVLIVRGETLSPEEFIDKVEKERREKEKNKGKDMKAERQKQKKLEADKRKKEMVEEKKRKQKAEAEARRKEENLEYEFKLGMSSAQNLFLEAYEEHRQMWDARPFEENPKQEHYMDLIHEEKCHEVQLELRPLVDQMMRLVKQGQISKPR